MKKINNKGFTLVELLAVLVILSTISLVAVGGISNSLTKRTEKECQEQIELAKGAAKIYFSLEDVNSVTIGELKDNNYFTDDKKVDLLMNNDKIIIDNGYDYVDDGTGECKQK